MVQQRKKYKERTRGKYDGLDDKMKLGLLLNDMAKAIEIKK